MKLVGVHPFKMDEMVLTCIDPQHIPILHKLCLCACSVCVCENWETQSPDGWSDSMICPTIAMGTNDDDKDSQ